MFVPPSPSQPEGTPGSVRGPTPLPGQGHVSGEVESGAEGVSTGRMIDKRRWAETAGTADGEGSSSSSSGGGSGGRLPTAVGTDHEKPTPISLREAKQVLDGDDWRPKVAALRQLQDQLAAAEGALDAEDSRDVVNFMESVAAACRALKNTKPEIAGAARVTQLVCAVISGLAKSVGSGFTASAAAIIPDLLPFLSTPREAVQEAVATSVEDMLAECPSPSVLRAATVSLVGSKKAYLRRKGSGFLCVAIERWPRDALRTTLPPIMGQMRKALFDADATVRREGRHTFGVFIRLWPAEGGGMYHALDRANQRAVLQEQPHVSNFIGGKAPKDGAASGGSNGAAAGGASAPPAVSGAAKAASSTSEASSSASAVPVVDKSTAVTAAAAAAAASAATRIALATGGGGGGGQRPAGVTQAQHRSLVALKVERDRRLKDQQRLAAAGVTKASSSSSSSSSAAGRVAGGGGGGGAGQGISLSSIPAVMSAPSSPTTPGGSGVSAFGFHSPPGSASGGASRLPAAPSSSCSDGLRRAARLALRKNDLMSPTLKRLLQDPAQLRTTAAGAFRFGGEDGFSGGAAPSAGRMSSAEAGAGVSSPGSVESGLDTEGDGVGGVGGRMTPGELRGSTSGALSPSPLGGNSSVGNESYLSSCSSSEEEDFDDEEEENEENDDEGGGGSSAKRGRNKRPAMPTRILFGIDTDDAAERPPPPQSPKQQRTSAIARAAANASAARHAALEMKPPPPRPPAPAPISTLPPTVNTNTATSSANHLQQHPKLAADLRCPPPSPRGGSVNCTPTKGILADRSGKGTSAASSTVKRRVRFEMEERAREAASLNSPCRSSSSAMTGGWWSKRSAADGEGDWGEGRERRSRAPVRRRLAVVFRALAAAVLVGTVTYLGGGGGGGGYGGVARRPAGCQYFSSSSSSFSSCASWSPACLPWSAVGPKAEVCPIDIGLEGPASVVVEEQGKGSPEGVTEHAAAGVSSDVADDAPGVVVVDDAVVEHAAAAVAAAQDQGAVEEVSDAPAHDAAIAAIASAEDLDHDRQQPPPAELHHHHHHHHHYQDETGSAAEGAGSTAAASQPKESSPSPLSAPPSESVWGWFEVGAATLSAAMLLAAVVWRSRGAVDGGDGWGGDDAGGGGPSTPLAGGGDGGGEGQELGRYQTMEMIKKGDTPATIRSVKRSRRIGSAQKAAPPGMLVVDLGAAALNMPNLSNA